jgi:F-type H+-transporting ATPase subunit b
MLIDWFTVGAQALNFIVLVGLLRHFLYRPILDAIDAREKKIAAELSDAAANKARAQAQHDEFQHKNEEMDQQRAALLKKAADDGNAERERLLDEARAAADAWSDKRRATLRDDAHALAREIRRRTQDEVFAIARRALADLSSTTLEERIAEVFTRRVRDLDGATKAKLAEAARKAADPVVVRSAFELPESVQASIQDALNRAFSAAVRIRFETAPELVGGIECATNGQKVSWTIADYLGSMEKGVAELLEEKETADAKPEASPNAKPEATANGRSEPRPASQPAAKSP